MSFNIFIKPSPSNRYISIYQQTLEMQKKEGKIFRQSFDTLEKEKKQIFWEIAGLDWTFYNFQIFIELLERFRINLEINEENNELILQSFDDLNMGFKMLCSWYYIAAGTHLRSFYEKNINWLHNHLTNRYERNCRTKIDEIFKNGQISYIKEPDLLKFPVHEEMVYKIYWFLSHHYVHNGINNLDIKFNRDAFVEGIVLMDICIHTIARLINIAIGDDLEAWPLKEKILHQVEEYPFYFSYVQRLFGFGITTSPEVFFFNYLYDSKIARELILKRMWFKLEDLCSDRYLKSHKEDITW